MLTFFRRIRKGLVEGGSTSKYLLYAIGEILLVMIGILLALQVNNWNEKRKQRIKEKEVLQILINNLELNIQTLKSDILGLDRLNRSAIIAINALDEKLPYVDSLGFHFHHARIPKSPLSISQSGYEQFKNIGYDIINDDMLKQEVINYFEFTFPKWWTNYLEVNYKNESFFDYHVPLFHYKTLTIEPIDIDSLYTDQYFIGWIKAYRGGRITLIQMEQNLVEETQRVLLLIKDVLDVSE